MSDYLLLHIMSCAPSPPDMMEHSFHLKLRHLWKASFGIEGSIPRIWGIGCDYLLGGHFAIKDQFREGGTLILAMKCLFIF